MLDRAYGALVGGAIGDAMGMPASFLTRAQIRNTYGYIHDFLEPEKSVQDKHGDLKAGEITDDTMESIIIAHVIIENNGFSAEAFNSRMREWAIENKMLETTVIGPSTRRYLTAIINGDDPVKTAGQGVTNGSAMRVAPVGVKYHDDFEGCLKAALASSLPSHGSKPAAAAACAVAAAVSGGVHGGYSVNEILNMAYEGAKYGEERGADITAPSVARRIRYIDRIVDGAGSADMSDIMDEVVEIFGSSMFSYESVPVALAAFYAAKGNGRDGVLAAINAGDDADTNGAICGNICGAYSGASSFPDEWKNRVQKTSSIDMESLAEQLLK